MNIPNSLTLMRIFFVPLLVAALVTENRTIRVAGVFIPNEYVALAIFLAAAGTDLLDGYLARRWKQITTVGMLLDPVADKLLISSALISLVQVQAVPAWMAILVIGREFAVTGLRGIAAASGYTIQASDLGKTKMVAQVVAISLLMLTIHNKSLQPVAMLWMWGVVFFGVVSAVHYFLKFWKKVDLDIKLRRRQELIQLERLRRRQARAERMARRREASVGEPS
ncbi:MAG: CDP-diacylglycerol--glycerol-3-phosphate 3-phosphatidyltransferase [Bryobacteraceae bacterium]|nr:CDP-diacylglycerol--glycerol-3-phosphate 3-phosphatidyltransferase [Bryobacteraceae bacterium]MDW8377074.1 CDP-diacylglycerol--glycerol-3-phosphate 3-phosphatidyltransferase [Bryobacterales bacterium]